MSHRVLISATLTCLILTATIDASDLYRVDVNSSREARALTGSGADAVVRLRGGYLVLIEPDWREQLAESGLTFELVAVDVDRTNLALGTHHDGSSPEGGELIFADEDLRLYRVDIRELQRRSADPGAAPLPERGLRVVYKEAAPRIESKQRAAEAMDLEALIALVNRDSLESYTSQLQAFPNRLTGSLGNRASRDWIFGRLQAYGYDSVYLDSFVASVAGTPTNAQNVIAVKPGVTYPDHYVIVGAHRDAVASSPGADDNGSGTAGVLEIARVLADIPTELTFIFALFDAEEQGLYGSYHYASEAAARGDSIVMMLNMDMIGYSGNASNVKVYFGADTVWADRWKTVADSLSTDLIGVYSGLSSQSDHYPFQQEGYDVVFLIEYVFSTVYHTYRDSTTYMGWDYMRRIVQASLATAYDADAAYVPMPGVSFAEVDPVPTLVPPAETTVFQMSILPGPGGTLVAGSPALHYSFDGAEWKTSALTDLGGGVYGVPLPGPLCDGGVQFYVSAAEATTGIYCYPDTTMPWWAGAASSSSAGFADNFESDLGWATGGTAAAGLWNRGVPAGGGDRGDPPVDYDGSGQCFLTGNTDGDSDIDGGSAILTSPTFDASGGDNALISYARWFSNDFGSSPYEDYMDVFISNDNGVSWVLAERVGPSGAQASGDWYQHSFMAGDFVAPSSQMKVRFTAADYGNGSVVEAAIDAFEVTITTCTPNYFLIVTDDLPEWTAGIAYSQQLQAAGGAGAYMWADKYGNLEGSGLSLSAGGLLGGVPISAGTIGFTAMCTDESDSTVEQNLALTINPEVAIATLTLPGGIAGDGYNQTLAANGGTGAMIWSNPDNGLVGTGLMLSSAGVITGTLYDPGTFSFNLQVVDAVGSSDVHDYTVVVEPQFFCGDVDNSRGAPNVSDLTYLVAYLFRGGPEPVWVEAADVNGDGSVTVADLTRLVDFMFRGGAPLTC